MKALKIGNSKRHSITDCRFRALSPRDLEERSGSRERGGSVRKRHGPAREADSFPLLPLIGVAASEHFPRGFTTGRQIQPNGCIAASAQSIGWP